MVRFSKNIADYSLTKYSVYTTVYLYGKYYLHFIQCCPSCNENYENKSKEEIEAFLKENEITIVNKTKIDVPKPVFSFEECGFSENGMLKPLEKAGFDKPMAIQAQGWPIAMSGFDMIGIGETGSGKTLGFLMPAFQHIAAKKLQGEGPRVLILSPTRELAQQTEKVAHRYYTYFAFAFNIHRSLDKVCIFTILGYMRLQGWCFT